MGGKYKLDIVGNNNNSITNNSKSKIKKTE